MPSPHVMHFKGQRGVERMEISTEEPRTANVLLRFCPKEIASRIPGIEPSLLKQKPKKKDLVAVFNVDGASDGN